MNEFEFARNFLGRFNVKGDEIIPELCPFCHGGSHRDKYSFALNYVNHTFNCKRGSCDKKGHFSQLCKEFNVEMDKDDFGWNMHPKESKKEYKPSTAKPEPITDIVFDYLNKRGLTQETLKEYRISSHEGNIMFPYYRSKEDAENNVITFAKFRKPHKIPKGERKMWREAGTEPILFGMNVCDENDPSVIIAEGEFDAMIIYQCTGRNVVSVPSGCEDFTWIDTCHDWIKRFNQILVFGDNDTPGKKMIEELSKKLTCNVLVPDYELYLNCKDANEIYVRHGAEQIKKIVEYMKTVPVEGLIDLSEVESVNPKQMRKALSSFKGLDNATGGFMYGDLSIWTGKRGEGKSTFLNQILLDCVDQGINTCIYSGEIPAQRLKYWINLQAAGDNYVESDIDERSGKTIYYVPKNIEKLINKWDKGKIWVYDNRIVTKDESETILKIFEMAYRRYDCRVFFVDNLMTVNTNSNERDIFQKQANFTLDLVKFCREFNVHVHLVVHPRKTSGTIKDNDSVGGLGTITNAAHNVFSVHKCTEEEKHKLNCDSVLSCLKNRFYGETGDVPLMFSYKSRRFTERSCKVVQYGWEKYLSGEEQYIYEDDPPF